MKRPKDSPGEVTVAFVYKDPSIPSSTPISVKRHLAFSREDGAMAVRSIDGVSANPASVFVNQDVDIHYTPGSPVMVGFTEDGPWLEISEAVVEQQRLVINGEICVWGDDGEDSTESAGFVPMSREHEEINPPEPEGLK